jgi:hypothetical protein
MDASSAVALEIATVAKNDRQMAASSQKKCTPRRMQEDIHMEYTSKQTKRGKIKVK